MTQENALKIFKSLSDMSRLRIIQSLTKGDMYTELLAERLNLTPSTVSFHMKKLEDAGLVVPRKEQYYTVYSLNRSLLEASVFDIAASEPEQIDEQQKREGAYRQKVIDTFKNPKNVGAMENPDAVGTVGNSNCGDIMKIYLKWILLHNMYFAQ